MSDFGVHAAPYLLHHCPPPAHGCVGRPDPPPLMCTCAIRGRDTGNRWSQVIVPPPPPPPVCGSGRKSTFSRICPPSGRFALICSPLLSVGFHSKFMKYFLPLKMDLLG
eukprot:EG_transcript_13006